MADTITISSPSLFLNASDASPPAQNPAQRPARRPPLPASPTAPKASDGNAITKRKQSKSRNGCITCKAKRLKCDETKPTCKQCARRSVPCGGYKKDFKWRPFEETNFTTKPPTKSKKGSTPPGSATTPTVPAAPALTTPATPNDPHPIVPKLDPRHHGYYPPPRSRPIVTTLPPESALSAGAAFVASPYSSMGTMYAMSQTSSYMVVPPLISPLDNLTPATVESINESINTLFESDSMDTSHTKTTTPSSVSSGQSPRLVDLLLPGTDLNVPPEEYSSFREQHEAFYQPTGFTPPGDAMDEDVEEIPRSFNAERDPWLMRVPSPTPSHSSSSSSDSRDCVLYVQPHFSITSPEMLTRRFDRETCGILSVKDGPTENPWRTLIWPLARDCPALYHAIASLTSFHQSRDSRALRIQGIDHMNTALQALASSLENMRFDAAISTTLVLAFSESWDQHISTGINHIKGAKILIDRALTQHSRNPMRGDEFTRLKFLCKSWIYIDVIARLTSADDDEFDDYDALFENSNMVDQNDAGLDPLMGCASSLFPIIGRVANLVRKVRRTDGNSPSIISQSVELKRRLEDWMPPSYIEDPEDETTTPHEARNTATAYKYATLLYLHQAVPEVPSSPSLALAKKILCELALVPPKSRSTIVHIYPLMAAGCEMVDPEDRKWVRERWELMHQRMKIGVIEKCLEVTKEVWSRRDAYAAESCLNQLDQLACTSPTIPSLKREFCSTSDFFEPDGGCWRLDLANKRRAVGGAAPYGGPTPVPVSPALGGGFRRLGTPGTENLKVEFTVKGRLHWLGVMKDWNWEVLLG